MHETQRYPNVRASIKAARGGALLAPSRREFNSGLIDGPSIYARDSGRCVYCGKDITITRACRDHVIPKSIGGPAASSNFVTACYGCNRRKASNLPPVMLLQAIAHLIRVGEDVGWMYEYGHRVQKMREDVSTAEKLASFLLGVLPERVVEDHQPGGAGSRKGGTQEPVTEVTT